MYIKANVLLNHIILCLFLISMHPIQSSDIFAGNSYRAKNINCGTFTICTSCTINNTVRAESGTVGNAMTAKEIYINNSLNVGSALTTDILKCKSFDVKNRCTINNTVEADQGEIGTAMIAGVILIKDLLTVRNSLEANSLTCNSFDVGTSCTINNTVRAESGTVGNAMTAKEMYIKNSLNVGSSLTTDILKCKSFDVKNSCTINATVESESGTVGNSMKIKKGGKIDKDLVVGKTLTCFKTHIPIFAQLYIIKAKESTFGEVHIKNTYSVIETKGSTVNIMSISNFFLPYLYSFVYYLINKVKSLFWTVPDNQQNQLLNDSSMEEEISTFENCTVGSIVVDKNNNKKQIIELKNTTVSGDITFANGTHGEVKRSGLTHVNGKVHNSLYQNDDTVIS